MRALESKTVTNLCLSYYESKNYEVITSQLANKNKSEALS